MGKDNYNMQHKGPKIGDNIDLFDYYKYRALTVSDYIQEGDVVCPSSTSVLPFLVDEFELDWGKRVSESMFYTILRQKDTLQYVYLKTGDKLKKGDQYRTTNEKGETVGWFDITDTVSCSVGTYQEQHHCYRRVMSLVPLNPLTDIDTVITFTNSSPITITVPKPQSLAIAEKESIIERLKAHIDTLNKELEQARVASSVYEALEKALDGKGHVRLAVLKLLEEINELKTQNEFIRSYNKGLANALVPKWYTGGIKDELV